MKDKITVIITIRNREASRIENQVNSIRKYGANPTIHVVDYGSDEKYKKQYEEICCLFGNYNYLVNSNLCNI